MPQQSRQKTDEIDRLAQRLPVAAAPEEDRLRPLRGAAAPPAACDAIRWSVWQDQQTREVWVHCTGGVGGIDVWYGPGDESAAEALSSAQPDRQP